MADKEAFLVVVGINKPASDAVGVVRADFTSIRVEHIYAIDLDADFAGFFPLGVGFRQDGNIRLAEDDKQVSLAGRGLIYFFQV